MIIQYLGDGFFKVQNGETVLLIDPTSARHKGDIIVRTTTPTDEEPPKEDIVTVAGEYEFKEIDILGTQLTADSNDKEVKTAYLIKWDDIVIASLGAMKTIPEGGLSEELGAFGEIDVLLIPTGPDLLSDENAAHLTRQLEPAVVIPAWRKSGATFAKALGEDAQMQEKFVFKKKELSPNQMKPIILESQN